MLSTEQSEHIICTRVSGSKHSNLMLTDNRSSMFVLRVKVDILSERVHCPLECIHFNI